MHCRLRLVLLPALLAVTADLRAESEPAGETKPAASRLFEITLHRFAMDHDRAKAREGFAASAAADAQFAPARQNLALLAEAAHDWEAALRWQAELAQSADTAVAARAQVESERLKGLQLEWQTEAGQKKILGNQATAQARALIVAGKYAEAAGLARTALRLEANRFDAHAILADALARGGDIPAALVELQEARRLAPPERTAAFDRAIEALGHDGEFNAAVARGDELMRKGTPAEAGAELMRAFNLRPEREDLGLAAANALFLGEKHTEAAALLKELAGSTNAETSQEAGRLQSEFYSAMQNRSLLSEARAELGKQAAAKGVTAAELRQKQDERVRSATEAATMRESGKALLAGDGVDRDPASGAAWLLKAAQAGDVEAMALLADCLDRGQGVQRNSGQAAHWRNLAAEAGDAGAMEKLGDAHYYGTGVERSYPNAEGWWKQAWRAGRVTAALRLGNAARDQKTAEKDAEALQWWARGAAQGEGECMFRLGVAHRDGHGTAKSAAQAAAWWTKGAAVGNTDSAYFLGFVYEYGSAVPKDSTRAFQYWKQAADAGHNYASAQVGVCYLKGRGVYKDVGTGLGMIEKAVKDGADSMEAYECLATAYYRGEEINRDVLKGVQWAKKAADKGSVPAMVVLGDATNTGLGADLNTQAAAAWYRKASDKGDMEAKFRLGSAYSVGRGVPRDEKEAVSLYQSAAYGGHVLAMRSLAQCYRFGTGVAKSKYSAKMWYERAAEKGDEQARETLEQFYSDEN